MKLVATVSSVDEINAAGLADIVELRLDLGDFPKRALPKREYIVTFRRVEDGGAYRISDDERLKVLRGYCDIASYVDLEHDLADEVFDTFDCKVIESYHNFRETPEYSFMLDLVEGRRGDIFKIAVMGRSRDDVRKILKIVIDHDDVVAFLMGEKFTYTRILAALAGSPFIYCFVGSSKAPGQLELEKAVQILELLGLR